MSVTVLAVTALALKPVGTVGGSVSPSELLAVSRLVGIAPSELRTVMYDLPLPSSGGRRRQIDPCPMSTREVEVLRRLARGMVYKQIASELGLSTSTVRTHLHNVYGKLGAMDRAQAVLIATERGWIESNLAATIGIPVISITLAIDFGSPHRRARTPPTRAWSTPSSRRSD